VLRVLPSEVNQTVVFLMLWSGTNFVVCVM
jgi:hypothetical protein